MTATPDPGPDPLAALPLLREAGVSVYWQALDGRTAWVADATTREVWISRAIPREAVLGSLVAALQAVDDGAAPPVPQLVHSVDDPAGDVAPSPAPVLRVVRDA